MKIEQFRQDLTTEQLNDTLGKVFGTAIDLTKFSTEQLETAQNQVSVSYTHLTLPTKA